MMHFGAKVTNSVHHIGFRGAGVTSKRLTYN